MASAYHELYWAYSTGFITFEQLKDQLALLNEMEEIKRTVA